MARRRNVLMIVPHYSEEGGARTMADEMAEALAARGNRVQVVAIRWNAAPNQPPTRETPFPGLDVIRLAPYELGGLGRVAARLSKWLWSSRHSLHYVKTVLAGRTFDLIVAASPVITCRAIVNWAMRTNPRAATYLHIVDFFPIHHQAIGLVPHGPVGALAKLVENRLINRFEIVGCMSERNRMFLRHRYRLKPRLRVEILPIYGETVRAAPGDRNAVRQAHGLPTDQPIALFGGQLTEGRGIPEILEAARIASEAGDRMLYLFVGDGRLGPLVDAEIERGSMNIRRIPQVSRIDYLPLAAACDLGLVVTVAIADVPTFPSKTIDYLRAGLPIVAAVEASTDYGEIVEANGFGVAIEAGNAAGLRDAIVALERDPARMAAMRQAGAAALDRLFDAQAAAKRLIDQVGT